MFSSFLLLQRKTSFLKNFNFFTQNRVFISYIYKKRTTEQLSLVINYYLGDHWWGGISLYHSNVVWCSVLEENLFDSLNNCTPCRRRFGKHFCFREVHLHLGFVCPFSSSFGARLWCFSTPCWTPLFVSSHRHFDFKSLWIFRNVRVTNLNWTYTQLLKAISVNSRSNPSIDLEQKQTIIMYSSSAFE